MYGGSLHGRRSFFFFSNRLLLTTRVVTRLVQPPGKLDVQTVFAALSSWKVVAPCFTVKLQSDRSLKWWSRLCTYTLWVPVLCCCCCCCVSSFFFPSFCLWTPLACWPFTTVFSQVIRWEGVTEVPESVWVLFPSCCLLEVCQLECLISRLLFLTYPRLNCHLQVCDLSCLLRL